MAWTNRQSIRSLSSAKAAATTDPIPALSPGHHWVLGVCATIAVTLIALDVHAQGLAHMDTGNPNITVDLSVLEDGGYQAAPSSPSIATSSAYGRLRLQMPGPRAPLSQFFAPAGSKAANVSLPAPARSKTAAVRTAPAAPKTKPAPRAPRAKTTAKRIAAAVPAAAPVAPVAPKTPLAPPPKTAPVKKVVASKIAPPAVKKLVAKETAQAAAPPPPPSPPRAQTKSVAAVPAMKTAPAKQNSAQVSSLPAATGAIPGQILKVVFDDGVTTLPGAAKAPLKSLAASMKGKDDPRLQLHAYAGGKSLSASKARRLSLSRALSVRSYLIETGVRSTRIDVRALGNKASGGPLNRVDVVVVNR